jgi:glycosidase
MPWHAGENGGFSDGEPWIGLGDNYREINVEAALADPDSVFYAYQQLITLRKTLPLLTWGDSGSPAGPSVAVVLSPSVAGANAGGRT